jgi:predicted GIY-YIG superfamily endonuclease
VVVVTGSRAGVVYLLCFDRPFKHARHYRGWTFDLERRLAEHRAGHGARLIAVITATGIGFTVAKAEPGSRARERQLKQRGAGRDCPRCIARRVLIRRAAEAGLTRSRLAVAA